MLILKGKNHREIPIFVTTKQRSTYISNIFIILERYRRRSCLSSSLKNKT
ncbi:hypothetical protein Tmel_0719 [Thermosipho melanesiensis BI429]|uniref:Uncharacterized protein n=1 Tax=Thermosipho melanesiensis (strain DSM 12029 / CIP 104789 / BI429) TaxID=391009 RepID=A6LKY2_THEM4|nr:hypothetical protein Tmel_0719 [Thermosipho melanesiensis BI429]